MSAPNAYLQLLEAFDQLPSIGPKAAERISNYLVRSQSITQLQQALSQAQTLTLCTHCQAFTDVQQCTNCQRAMAHNTPELLVVESFWQQRQAINAGFHGIVFVLHGLLSPIAGVGPQELQLPKLLALVEQHNFAAITLALTNNAEGQTTQQYIQTLLGDAYLPQCLTFEQWQAKNL